MRSLLIAFAGDPYLALWGKELYRRFWANEVDELHVHVNSSQPFINDFITGLWPEATQLIVADTLTRQGEAFNQLYPQTRGDVLITLDSDNFIYRSGVISEYADLVSTGQYDYVGSHRPYMSFWNRKVLDQIDVDFSEYHLKKGDFLTGLGRLEEDRFYDVMKLLFVRFSRISQRVFEIPVDKFPYYEHVGRLSSLAVMMDKYNSGEVVIDRSVLKALNRVNRAAYAYFIFQRVKTDFPYSDYNDFYLKTFWAVMDKIGFNQAHLDKSIRSNIMPKLDFLGRHA